MVRKVVKNLPTNKIDKGGIPVKTQRESEFSFNELFNCINEAFKTDIFPAALK